MMSMSAFLKQHTDYAPGCAYDAAVLNDTNARTPVTHQNTLSIIPVSDACFEGLDKLYKYSLSVNKEGFIQNLAFHGDIKAVAMRCQEEGGAFVVGLLNGEVVAMGGLRIADNGLSAELCKLHVSPNHQGKGYGRLVCEYMIDRAIEKNIQQIKLHVTVTQHAALSLYNSLGFLTDKTELCVIEFQGERMEFETAFLSKTL